MREFDKQMEMVLYHSDEGDVSIDAYIKGESIWITQKAMAELFGVKVPDISKHLSNIYDEGELAKEATISKMEIVQREGTLDVKRTPVFYNLDAIISVGYRVNSIKATKFRIWATTVLKEYMTKGFVLDDDRLKQGKTAFGKDYFRELLERVRSIRASERRIWQQITDIFAECSIDYTKDSEAAYDMVSIKIDLDGIALAQGCCEKEIRIIRWTAASFLLRSFFSSFYIDLCLSD